MEQRLGAHLGTLLGVGRPSWELSGPVGATFWTPKRSQKYVKNERVFGSHFGPKLDPKMSPKWGPKCGPNRPRKLPRWPSNAQKSAEMSSKSLLHGSFSAPLKPYKNLVFYDGLGLPGCPRATRETPKRPHVAILSPQEATKRTA